MVFFTCSYCGDSVKKPAVAKHYQTKCKKKEPLLSCQDCLKDFKGNEHEAHTKCVSEEEKYSAKGFVPKPNQNKGERKQQVWSECIQTVLKKPTLKPDEKDLIRAISKYENVPRKKAKFNNFLANAFRQYASKSDLIDRVWAEMETLFKEMSANSQQQNQQQQKQESKNVAKKPAKTEEAPAKKEKKRKRAEDDKGESATESGKSEEKKKKKKQNEEKPVEDEAEPGKKKKKKKSEKPAENVSEPPAQKPEEESKGKKKNKKPKSGEAETKEKATTGAGDASAVKKEKKPKKSENKENCVEKPPAKNKNAKPEPQPEPEKPAPKKKKTKPEAAAAAAAAGDEKPGQFDWKVTILKVLNQDGKNNRIQLQKLQKKVLKLHCQTLNCENSEKKEKTFMKKLREMSELSLDNDFVVLKS